MAKSMVPCQNPGAHPARFHVAGSQAAKECALGAGRTPASSRAIRDFRAGGGVPAPQVASGGSGYTEEQWRKVAGPKAEFITDSQARQLLSAPSGSRPRMYGFKDGQIIKVGSTEYLDEHAPERVWLSGTTVADLVGPAPSPLADTVRRNEAIADIRRVASQDRVAEMLDTEFGDHFDPGSLWLNDDGSEARLRVDDSFGYRDRYFSRGDEVSFNPDHLPDITLHKVN